MRNSLLSSLRIKLEKAMRQLLDAKSTFSANRVIDQQDVDVIVTDSPLPLSLLYMSDPVLKKDNAFQKVVMNVFNSYNNLNYYVNRVKPYNPKGRNQTEEESDALAAPLKKLINENDISYMEINGDDEGYAAVVKEVAKWLGL